MPLCVCECVCMSGCMCTPRHMGQKRWTRWMQYTFPNSKGAYKYTFATAKGGQFFIFNFFSLLSNVWMSHFFFFAMLVIIIDQIKTKSKQNRQVSAFYTRAQVTHWQSAHNLHFSLHQKQILMRQATPTCYAFIKASYTNMLRLHQSN